MLAGLSSLFNNHTFVGCADANHCLIQHQTKLYLVNVCTIRYANDAVRAGVTGSRLTRYVARTHTHTQPRARVPDSTAAILDV